MKYRCDVIRDLMPLCADDTAAAGSREIVFEHLGECKACERYYKEIVHEIYLEQDTSDPLTSEYTAIANRCRKRNLKRRACISILAGIIFLLLLNYALGYRFTALGGAERSGRLNPTSEVIGTYDWDDVQFFFYGSEANYDTIASVKHWNGWRSENFFFVWPKYPMDKDGVVVTSGLYYFNYDRGILLLPVLSADEEISKVTVSAFGQTQSVPIQTGKLSVLAFENQDPSLEETATGYAYDRNGHIKYELEYDEATGRWVWERKIQ